MLDSANQNNPSLRDFATQNRGNPPIKKMQKSQGGLPRSHSLARNDDSFLDSSPMAQNDKIRAENDNFKEIAESALDSAHSTHEANSSIVDEFLGFCEASDTDRTLVHQGSEPKQSLKSRHKTNLP